MACEPPGPVSFWLRRGRNEDEEVYSTTFYPREQVGRRFAETWCLRLSRVLELIH